MYRIKVGVKATAPFRGTEKYSKTMCPLRGTEKEVLSPVAAAAALAFCRFLLC